MASGSLTSSTPAWSVPALLQATPRGKELWERFDRSRIEVFTLTRTEQESFYALEKGEVTPWQHSLALGALERAVADRGAAWDAVVAFAEEAGIDTGCPSPDPTVSSQRTPHIVGRQRCTRVGRTAAIADDPAFDHLRDATREARAEER